MNKFRILFLIVLTVGSIYKVDAQDDLDAFLGEGVADGEKLIGAYISPAIKAFSLGMNQGWYNTAKPHKVAGFDLTFTGSLMKVPSSEQTFDAGALGLTSVTVVDPLTGLESTDQTMSTLLGPDNPATLSSTSTLGNTTDDFEAPTGVDLGSDVKILKNKMPAAMLQLGFGLPKGTDIKIRLIPTVDLGNDSEYKLFGIGVMHDVKQHIPGLKNLPFDLSALIGYTKMKMNVTLDPGQSGLFEVKSTTIQGIISKKLSVVTFYGALGYNIAKSRLALLGDFDINGTNYTNPVDLDFAASGMRLTTGMRLKLAVFTLHADYTVQKYNALTVGFGINVR
jgi:hypothetical protein